MMNVLRRTTRADDGENAGLQSPYRGCLCAGQPARFTRERDADEEQQGERKIVVFLKEL